MMQFGSKDTLRTFVEAGSWASASVNQEFAALHGLFAMCSIAQLPRKRPWEFHVELLILYPIWHLMVSDTSILDPIRQSNHFGQWLEQLNRDWEAEQRYRHDFWASHDEGAKAEFINDYATHGVREY